MLRRFCILLFVVDRFPLRSLLQLPRLVLEIRARNPELSYVTIGAIHALLHLRLQIPVLCRLQRAKPILEQVFLSEFIRVLQVFWHEHYRVLAQRLRRRLLSAQVLLWFVDRRLELDQFSLRWPAFLLLVGPGRNLNQGKRLLLLSVPAIPLRLDVQELEAREVIFVEVGRFVHLAAGVIGKVVSAMRVEGHRGQQSRAIVCLPDNVPDLHHAAVVRLLVHAFAVRVLREYLVQSDPRLVQILETGGTSERREGIIRAAGTVLIGFALLDIDGRVDDRWLVVAARQILIIAYLNIKVLAKLLSLPLFRNVRVLMFRSPDAVLK